MINYKELIKTEDYDFLRVNPVLGDNIVFLTLGGSRAYGTSKEGSDIDIRGVAIPNKEAVFIPSKDFEIFNDTKTDTVVYSLSKIFNLLTKCNPNTIEILGTRPEDIIVSTPLFDEILENKKMFLSQKAISSFRGYALDQLRRMETLSARELGQSQREEYIFKSIQNAENNFNKRLDEDVFKLHIEKSDNPDFDTEIMVDISLDNYSLRDLSKLISGYNAIVKNYDKIGSRNKKAVTHGKLSKHMMHLFRLYYMAFDILEKQEINTYREVEHDELMAIRNGKYVKDDFHVNKDFYKAVDNLEKRFEKAKNLTELPLEPNYDAIDKFYIHLIEKYVL